MRLLLILVPILLLAASTAGCGSKAPTGSHFPAGVIENPVCPDPEAIKSRKRNLIDPRPEAAPSRSEDKR